MKSGFLLRTTRPTKPQTTPSSPKPQASEAASSASNSGKSSARVGRSESTLERYQKLSAANSTNVFSRPRSPSPEPPVSRAASRSPTEEGCARLPDREELLARLIAVNDNDHYQAKLYPLILSRAGTQLYAEGLQLHLVLCIHQYTQGMPPLMQSIVNMDAMRFLDAMVPDNPSVLLAAKSIWHAVHS